MIVTMQTSVTVHVKMNVC